MVYNVEPFYKDDLNLEKEFKGNKGFIVPNHVDNNLETPIGMNHIGKTVADGTRSGQNILQNLRSAINQGASRVELDPDMEGSTTYGGLTSYGDTMKNALKEVSVAAGIKINSIHTPTDRIANLSGYNAQQGMFSKEFLEQETNALKASIDFAVDVVDKDGRNVSDEGVSLVVHTGEHSRNFSELPNGDKEHFKSDRENVHSFIDTETGKVTPFREGQELPFNTKFIETFLEEKENGLTHSMEEYKKYDETLKLPSFMQLFKVAKDIANQNKHVNDKTGIAELKWNDFEKIADELNNIYFEKKNNLGLNEKELDRLNGIKDIFINEGNKDSDFSKITPTEVFSKMFYVNQGLIDPHANLTYYEAEKEQVTSQIEELKYEIDNRHDSGFDPEKAKRAIPSLEFKKKQIDYTLFSQVQKSLKALEDVKKVQDFDKFAKKTSFDTFADMALYTYKKQKEKKIDKNIYLAPENMFPEMGYGSHPDELKELILNSRKAFAKKLVENEKMNEKEAKKIADEKIKATFDTQHLMMWGKYYQGTDEEFKNWYVKKVDELAKDGLIGNVHMVDGTKYGHSHAPVGYGDVPIKDAIKKIKDYYDKNNLTLPSMNSEGWQTPGKPGSGEQLMSAWREVSHFSNAYLPKQDNRHINFAEVEDSYFMKRTSPYFVYGEYAPTKNFSMWSGVPLE